MNDEVRKALEEMKQRRWNRALSGDLHGPSRMVELAALRETMFSRRDPGEAFHELNPRELSLIEDVVEGHLFSKRFRIAFSEGHPVLAGYSMIRHNHMVKAKTVGPCAFRAASNFIVRDLLNFVLAEQGSLAGSIMVLPWRAGLAFAEEALKFGITDFHHMGARRNEDTLATEIYFEEVPRIISCGLLHRGQPVIVADPMLATGNTIVTIVERLKNFGVLEKDITVLSIISAPEGVDHVLDRFPEAKIITGQHDERLNRRGFIEPGLGDFGDLYFEGLAPLVGQRWRRLGILSRISEQALWARMAA